MRIELDNCPICGIKIWMEYRKHVVQVARHEVWQKAIGASKKTPHFDYYFENTKQKTKTKRTWII